MPEAYKSLLLPGIMAISMVSTEREGEGRKAADCRFQGKRESEYRSWRQWKSRGSQLKRYWRHAAGDGGGGGEGEEGDRHRISFST